MGHQEEIELSIYDFRLLNKALIDIGSLGRIINELLSIVHRLLEESLSDSFVYDHKGNLGRGVLRLARLVIRLTICSKHAVLVLADIV
jgi:hypothetical protein